MFQKNRTLHQKRLRKNVELYRLRNNGKAYRRYFQASSRPGGRRTVTTFPDLHFNSCIMGKKLLRCMICILVLRTVTGHWYSRQYRYFCCFPESNLRKTAFTQVNRWSIMISVDKIFTSCLKQLDMPAYLIGNFFSSNHSSLNTNKMISSTVSVGSGPFFRSDPADSVLQFFILFMLLKPF
jgi:hypothetical protein